MNDNDFLDYVEIHSRTERALFHRDHVQRLFTLSGDPATLYRHFHEFTAIRSDVATPLVRRARVLLNINEARFSLIAGFMSEDPDHGIRMSLQELARQAYAHHEYHHEDEAKLLTEALEALQWCSGAQDFQTGGQAFIGYEKTVRPILQRLRERVRTLNRSDR